MSGEAIAAFENVLGFVAYNSPEVVYQNFGWAYYNLGRGRGSIMPSEEEKRELREMAASESLWRLPELSACSVIRRS